MTHIKVHLKEKCPTKLLTLAVLYMFLFVMVKNTDFLKLLLKLKYQCSQLFSQYLSFFYSRNPLLSFSKMFLIHFFRTYDKYIGTFKTENVPQNV